MATTYIVEGHLGGTYLSQDAPADIEYPCSSCGDSDIITYSFDSADEDDVVRALANAYRDAAWLDLTVEREEDATEEAVKDMNEEIDDMFDDEALDAWCNMLDAEFYDFSSLSYGEADYSAKRARIRAEQTPDKPVTDNVRRRLRGEFDKMRDEYRTEFEKNLAAWHDTRIA